MHSCYSIERKYLKNDNLKQMKVEITAKEKSKLTSLVFRLEIQTTYWSSETCSELNQTSTMGLFRELWSSLTGKFHRNDAVWLHENMMAAAHRLFFSSVLTLALLVKWMDSVMWQCVYQKYTSKMFGSLLTSSREKRELNGYNNPSA